MLFKKFGISFFALLVILQLPLNKVDCFANDAVDEVIILDDDAVDWISSNEAPKSGNNLLRIKFEKTQKNLSDADKKAINSMLKIFEKPDQKVKIRSFASNDLGEQKAREIAMQRMLNLRKNLIEQGFDINNVKFFVFGADGNKHNLDYIDIDKY